MKRFARWLTVRRRAAAVLSVADPTTGSDRTDALLQIRATAPLLYWAQAVAAQFALVSPVNWVYGSRAHVEGLAEPQRARARVRRARFIDRYIVAALVVSLVLLFGLWVGRTSFAASERVEMAWVLLGLSLVGLRVTDILQAATNMVLFDPIRNPTSPLSYTSVSRTFVNSAFNFLELILAGAFVYLALGDRFRPRIETPIDAVEQAIGVQFAFGLNSVGTTSGARVFVMGHLLVAFVFIILVLGRWITALPGGAR